METRQEQMRQRTKEFAVRIIRLFRFLPGRDPVAQVLGNQVLRSGTAVSANYRAAGRARSHAEFSSRIAVVAEEADETVYWLELLVETGVVKAARMEKLLNEAHELAAIFTASRETARQHRA